MKNISEEGGQRIIKRTLPEESPLDKPGGRVSGVENWGDKLFSKSFCHICVGSRIFLGGTFRRGTVHRIKKPNLT